tara:strand:+ start:425 stop:538 length:114 start_codon:yes stop_codon:yes gene_type:complete
MIELFLITYFTVVFGAPLLIIAVISQLLIDLIGVAYK